MKRELSPAMAVVVVVVIIAVIGGLYWSRSDSGGGPVDPNLKTGGMPPNVAAEFQKRMGAMTGPGGNKGSGGAPSSAPDGASSTAPGH